MPKIQNAAWLLVLAAALVATALFGRSPSATVLLGFATVNAIFVAFAVRGVSRSDARFDRPDGVLFLAVGQVLTLAALAATDELRLGLLLASGIVGAIGAILVVKFRLGARPAVTERETLIVSAALGVVFFILESRSSASILDGLFDGFVTAVALTMTLFSMGLLVWLSRIERVGIHVHYPLLLIPQAVLAFAIINIGDGFESYSLNFAALFASVMPIAAHIHPTSRDVLSITTFNSSELNLGRSLSTFSVILVGPALIAINQFTDLELSPAAITIASSILSVMVASHLLMLVRRWSDVEHQGQHDSLTGLPNRPVFFSRLATAIESARVRETKLVVMFLDLDRFKAVNDSFGHEKGDLLLRLVSDRLDSTAQRVDHDLTVARLGGDEFAIVVPSVRDDRHAHAIGRMFLDQFLEPFDMGLRDIYVTPSIGIAEFPRDGATVEQLIENADTAMFEAKALGRNTVVNYLPEQRTPGAHRLEIEAGIHKALTNNELEVYYQPQIDIESGNIFAVEALLRWEHPTLGLISPDKFVPVAEESNLIDAIGRWSLDEACRTAASWGPAGLPEINVAVNLSPRQFQKSAVLTDNVARALANSGLDPSRLELELTESLALERPEEVNATLVHFRDMGIKTAIDDFGVGHTGLDYLDRITVDTLKIDRSFINRIGESGAPLVTAVISLAKGLNLDVIAEGVETVAQVNFLRSHGCRYMQGYLFSKPLSAAQLDHVLRNQLNRNADAYRDAA